MTTYSIIRFRQNAEPEIVRTGVTLEEAKEHCQRTETQGKDWFDGWRAEKEEEE